MVCASASALISGSVLSAKPLIRIRPIMVHIINPGAQDGHWVVAYGYSLRPDRVFLAINGRPLGPIPGCPQPV